MTPAFEDDIWIAIENLFDHERRLNEFLEHVVDLYLATHRSWLNLTMQDIKNMETRLHERLDVCLVTIKMLLEDSRDLNSKLNDALVAKGSAISKAEARVQQQLNEKRKKDLS